MNHSSRIARLAACLGATAASAALLLSCGCLSQPYKGQTMFTMAPGTPSAAAATSKPHPGLLRLSGVGIAPPYSQTQFVYGYANNQMRVDPYAAFVTEPAVLLGASCIERLQAEHVFDQVVGPAFTTVLGYELKLGISTLGATFDDKGAGTATIAGRAFLLDPTQSPVAIIAEYSLTTTAPVTADTADAVAMGLQVAWSEWLTQLANKLRAQDVPPLTHPKKPSQATAK